MTTAGRTPVFKSQAAVTTNTDHLNMTSEMKSITLKFMFCLMLPIVSAEMVSGQALRHELGRRTERGFPMSQPAPTIKLGMNDQSIDDMYYGCTKKLAKKFDDKYFFGEIGHYPVEDAWKSATSCVKMAKKRRKFIDRFELNDNHLYAICLYTAEKPPIYKDFNTKVRTSAQEYNSQSFKYHALHFWLTSAIQALFKKNETCHQTVRRSKDTFTGEMNQIIRFGNFASTSYKKNHLSFGKKTCFSITTCQGAYLKQYPALGNFEQEVLIPPYEMFQITKITTAPYNGIEHCETIYVLNSVGIHSKLNCKGV